MTKAEIIFSNAAYLVLCLIPLWQNSLIWLVLHAQCEQLSESIPHVPVPFIRYFPTPFPPRGVHLRYQLKMHGRDKPANHIHPRRNTPYSGSLFEDFSIYLSPKLKREQLINKVSNHKFRIHGQITTNRHVEKQTTHVQLKMITTIATMYKRDIVCHFYRMSRHN